MTGRKPHGWTLVWWLDQDRISPIRHALRQPVTGNPNAHQLKHLWQAYCALEQSHLDLLDRHRKAVGVLNGRDAA